MTALTVDGGPTLRLLPVPIAEPRPALRVLTDRTDVPQAQGVLSLHEVTGTSPEPPAATVQVPPPAAAWTRQFVQVALEAAAGRRPTAQLVRWVSPEVLTTISRRAGLASQVQREGGRARCGSVRSVRLFRPRPGVIEACAVVTDQGRVRAVALRLEDAGGRWRVTALEIG